MSRKTTPLRIGRRALLGGAAAGVGGVLADRTAGAASPVRAERPQGFSIPTDTGPLTFQMLLTPVRAYDSRPGQPPDIVDIPFGLDTVRNIDISYVGGSMAFPTRVPLAAKAVLLNVTAVNTTGKGYLKVWSHSVDEPLISALNWYSAGAVVANSVTTMCNTGYVRVKCGGSTGASCHVIVDVLGFYEAVTAV